MFEKSDVLLCSADSSDGPAAGMAAPSSTSASYTVMAATQVKYAGACSNPLLQVIALYSCTLIHSGC